MLFPGLLEISYKEFEEKALGPDHPNLAITLQNMGIFYTSQGNFIEAESLFIRSLSIFEKAFGPVHDT
ncbi:MAG TPA: tetratricopeptide repeat protein, partial [Sulfurimonas sp.]|nr:tetratricopeptide repeat protein [Sulfurimonas sp.]